MGLSAVGRPEVSRYRLGYLHRLVVLLLFYHPHLLPQGLLMRNRLLLLSDSWFQMMLGVNQLPNTGLGSFVPTAADQGHASRSKFTRSRWLLLLYWK